MSESTAIYACRGPLDDVFLFGGELLLFEQVRYEACARGSCSLNTIAN